MKKGVVSVLLMLAGAAVGAGAVETVEKSKMIKKTDQTRKMTEFYHVLVEWLRIKQEGKSLTAFFVQNGYKTVAIYGMKELGERLYDELKDSEIKVRYVIDKKADSVYVDVDAVTPEDTLEAVDVIVVTAIHYFDEIDAMLAEKVDYPIVSLEDILYEV